MTARTLITNMKVKTAVGIGYINGYTKENPLTCLVQITITEENREHLADANCWTPNATHSALFEFQESEMTISK